MLKELVVNAAEHETRVAVLENGNIVELFMERGDESNITGNIYKGRVQRVLPGMQAAFVDIGLNQAAFLYVDDILDDTTAELAQRFEQENDADGDDDTDTSEAKEAEMSPPPSWKSARTTDCPIEDLITEAKKFWCRYQNLPLAPKGPG